MTQAQERRCAAQPRPAPAVFCAENIAFNYLLHDVPKRPQHKRGEHLKIPDQRYVLPFSKERDLVEILSFLSKTTDASDYIPAICVEQDPAKTSLTVLFAMNKSTWNDGNKKEFVFDLKKGFDSLFEALNESEYKRSSSTETKDEILNSILEMNRQRVLCRLRLSETERKGQRPSIKDILEKAIFGVQCINPDKICQLELECTSKMFITESNKVIRLVNNWSKYQTQSPRSMVEGICQLNTIRYLSNLLALIPSGASGVVQDSEFAKCLIRIISKVARYNEAATVLYRMAKRFLIVRNMKLLFATLPPEAYNKPPYSDYAPQLSTMVSRLGLINGRHYNLHQISHALKPQKNKSPIEQFSSDVKRALKGAKIHAEVQLIAYCEIKSPELWPRVIASSKDACFLCNKFIEEHGKMHTSRTHGRLYPGWKLPVLLQFKDLEQRFNKLLIIQAQETIGARLKGQKVLFPQPNESTLLPLSVSSATISTVREEENTPTLGKSRLPSYFQKIRNLLLAAHLFYLLPA